MTKTCLECGQVFESESAAMLGALIITHKCERERIMSEVIEKQGWCPDHYCYFVEAEGCETCNYEAEL